METDDLQDFIADCEYKTRKILRESNKRMKDSARLSAAKERVELLKQRGAKGADASNRSSAGKSLNKSFNKEVKPSLASENCTPKEWKGRDKIIHDACETIASFKNETPQKLPNQKTINEHHLESKLYESKFHSSLHASPFNDGKCSLAPASVKKASKKKSRGVHQKHNKAEPAVISRRTIERDFYIMSKKRSRPKPRRRQRTATGKEATPELKSSVLWKKYRCVDRIMEAKHKNAEKLFQKFERLAPFDDGSADEAAQCTDDESSSSEEDEYPHALHELLEAHVAKENIRSQRRIDKMLAKVTFKPNVKAMWEYLEQGQAKIVPKNSFDNAVNHEHSQVQSVTLQTATRKFISPPSVPYKDRCAISHHMDGKEASGYVSSFSPYKEPTKFLPLIQNELLPLTCSKESIHVSILYGFKPQSNATSCTDGCWVYEIYRPCDGNLQIYRLSEDEFSVFNSKCSLEIRSSIEPRAIGKIVHEQDVEINGHSLLNIVVVSVDGVNISAAIYRSREEYSNKDDCVDVNFIERDFDKIGCFRACQVLQLLGKQCIYSIFDTEFWTSNNNEIAIWTPLLDIVCNARGLLEHEDVLSRCVSAFDSLIKMNQALEKADGPEMIDDIFLPVQQGNSEKKADDEAVMPPLSMRISNHSPYSKTICPGHTATGNRPGIWRLTQPIVENHTNTVFPPWLTDAKYPSHLDKTQASAYLYYKNLGPQKGSSITILSRLAFESPVFSPHCYAIDRGFIVPPVSQPELVNGVMPSIKLSCKSLLESQLKSRFDTMLPPTVVVLDPAATDDDWKDAPRDDSGNVYHIRHKSELNEDGFRIKTFAHKIKYDDTVESRVYGISEKAAVPNSKATASILTHQSTDFCSEYLSRKRTANDYHYIAESDGSGTANVPCLFATHMKAYTPVYVSRKSITSYQDEEQFLLATKEAEAKKSQIALKIRAAEEMAEAKLREKMERIHQSMELTIADQNGCIDLPSALSADARAGSESGETPNEIDSLSCYQNENEVDEETDDLNQMANMLLNDSSFLRAIARKLNLSENKFAQNDQTDSATQCEGNRRDGQQIYPKEPIHEASRDKPIVPKLDLSCKTYRGSHVVGVQGDGWKRLPRADTLIGEFKLNNRRVEKNRGEVKFDGFEGRRNFFAVNAVNEIKYDADPESYGVKTTTMFIPDLATERLRLSQSQRQQKHYEKSLLSDDQKFSLQEILQIPVSNCNRTGQETSIDHNADESHMLLEDPVDENPDSVEPSTRAILAVKNHNLQQLEQILDTQGLSVEIRDQHGNTLFILACQQGSKRLAKFLLRRGADINAQNNGGNTALHYLHEYHHKLLAEYLLRKGADDSILNAEGLTVYEGVHQEYDVGE